MADADLWGVVGGGLETGETLQVGIQREFIEEIGLVVNAESVLFITENLWRHAQNKNPQDDIRMRAYVYYFLVEPVTPFKSAHPAFTSVEGNLKFAWFPLSQLPEIDFVPQFMVSHLVDLEDADFQRYPQMIFQHDFLYSSED